MRFVVQDPRSLLVRDLCHLRTEERFKISVEPPHSSIRPRSPFCIVGRRVEAISGHLEDVARVLLAERTDTSGVDSERHLTVGLDGDGPTRPEAQPRPAPAAHLRRLDPHRQDQHRASWRSPRERPPAPRRGVSPGRRRLEAREPLSPTTRQIARRRHDVPRWSRQASWFNHLASFGEKCSFWITRAHSLEAACLH